MPNSEEVTPIVEEHRMIVDPVGFVSEILNNIGDSRDIIRELLSNTAAKEVGAKNVTIKIYTSDKGLTITVLDDGCGMNYTKNNEAPGRLDKFLNAAQGRQAGFESDEFGAKGLGTKLLYNSEEVEIVTWDGGENVYRVLLSDPHRSVKEDKKLAVPYVHVIPANKYPMKQRGTSITVKGWAGILAVNKEFKIPAIERYLKYYTVIGYTKTDTKREFPFPEFVIYVDSQPKILKDGFPYMVQDDAEDIRTVTFGPIKVEKTTRNGKLVKISLKGGITLDTGKFDLVEETTGGVWVSVNGIPYFKLPKNKYAKELGVSDDLVRFVVECDDVNLNMSRSDFNYDEVHETFEDCLHEAFDKIKADIRFQKFDNYREKEIKKITQDWMNNKKKEFMSEDKRYVWYNEKMLLAEPEGETDTAAILWILEGMGALPFTKFKTLLYPGRSKGIDVLIDFQEEDDMEEKICAYAELEKSFSNIIKHKHDIGQMTMAICWTVDKSKVPKGKVEKTGKSYKYTYSYGGISIPVFEISKFPGIYTGTKKEAEDIIRNENI